MDSTIENKDKLFVENLREVLDRREIYAVAFDIDNTLLLTSKHFYEQTTNLSLILAPQIDKDRNPQAVAELMESLLRESYTNRKNRQPVLIVDWYLGGLHEYLGGDIPAEMEKKVREYLKDFYSTIPPAYESVPGILKTFVEINRKIVLHSHAQEDWTMIKTRKLSEFTECDLPYIATPIDREKDEGSWTEAFEIIDTDPINVLVIGDNLYADILPAIKAGSRNVVWIKRYDEKLPKDFNPDSVDISIIGDISELLDTFK